MKVVFNWTEEKKDKVIEMLEDWIITYHAFHGDGICQSDDCLIEAPYLLADLVDEVIKPEIIWEEND